MGGHQESISKAEIESLALADGMRPLWHINQERSQDDEFDWLVFAYEKPTEIAPDACATRVIGFGVTRTVVAGIQVVHRQEEWQLALRACSGITPEEFRPIIGETSAQRLAIVAGLLRAAMSKLGGASERVRFQSSDLEALFLKASPAALVSIETRSDGRVTATFAATELSPELLGVRIHRADDDTIDVQVYRENGPDPGL